MNTYDKCLTYHRVITGVYSAASRGRGSSNRFVEIQPEEGRIVAVGGESRLLYRKRVPGERGLKILS